MRRAEKLRGVAKYEMDHLVVERFLFRKSLRFGDGLFRQFRVAFAPLCKTSKKRPGVLVYLLSKYFIDLLRKSADRDDGRSRARMRARGHRGNVSRKKNVETCGSSARARRRNVHGHGYRGNKDVLDHVLHRIAQAAGRIHGDQNQRRVTPCRVRQPFIDVRSKNGFNFTIKAQFKNEWAGGVFVGTDRRQAKENHGREQQANRREGCDKSPFPARLGALYQSATIAHGAPPPGFFSLGLKFFKCSSNCLASP